MVAVLHRLNNDMSDGLKKDMYATIDPAKLRNPGEEGRQGGEVEIDAATLDRCEDEKHANKQTIFLFFAWNMFH
jgi:hypothetical protein